MNIQYSHMCVDARAGQEVLDDEDHDCFSNNHTCQHPAVEEEKCQGFSEVSKGKELRLYSDAAAPSTPYVPSIHLHTSQPAVMKFPNPNLRHGHIQSSYDA